MASLGVRPVVSWLHAVRHDLKLIPVATTDARTFLCHDQTQSRERQPLDWRSVPSYRRQHRDNPLLRADWPSGSATAQSGLPPPLRRGTSATPNLHKAETGRMRAAISSWSECNEPKRVDEPAVVDALRPISHRASIACSLFGEKYHSNLPERSPTPSHRVARPFLP